MNVLNIWKGKLPVFLQFLSDKVETIFWKSYAKHQKLCKGKFSHRNFVRKWFSSFFELKNKYCGRLKIAYIFLGFCKFLIDKVETIFWESEAKCSKLFKSKFSHRKLVRKWFLSYIELKNKCSEHLKNAFFSFLQILA